MTTNYRIISDCFHEYKITYKELVDKLDDMSYHEVLVGIHILMKYEYGMYELSDDDEDFVDFIFLLVNKYPEPNQTLPMLKLFVHRYEHHEITKQSIKLYRMYFDMAPVGSVSLPAQHFVNIYRSFIELEQTDIILSNLNKFKVTEKFIEVITGPIYYMDNKVLDTFININPHSILDFIFQVIVKESNKTVFEYLSCHLKSITPNNARTYICKLYNIPASIFNMIPNIIQDE